MTLAEIEAFLILAEELHFGHTAERLFLSQPRVSRLIASLEGEIGGRLFDRTSRRVRITPLGTLLREHFRIGLDRLQLGLDEATAAARGVAGTLRVGFTTTTEQTLVHDLVRSFDERYPDCEVVAIEVPVTDRYRSLRSDVVDVLMYWQVLDEPDLTIGPVLDRQPRVLAVASDHPLATRPSVSIEDFAAQPMLDVGAGLLPRLLADAMVPPSTPSGTPMNRLAPPVGLATLPEALALVERGKIVHPTVAALRDLFTRPGLAFIPIDDMPPIDLGPIWVTAHENARIRAFANSIDAGRRSPTVGARDGICAAGGSGTRS
ncbi:MAG TPA: LysR family transcriptional regulator [Ilumatobacter sp.]